MSILSLIVAGFCLSLAMVFAWLVQKTTGKSGWIDTIWSLSTGLVAIGLIFSLGPGTLSGWLVVCLLALWAGRLAAHIGARTRGSTDDPRYAALKAEWGRNAQFQMLVFLQYQAIAGWVLAASAGLAALNPHCGVWQAWFALVLGLLALAGEALSDRQLQQAKAAGERLCARGLWRATRHPNYFCEWLFWVAVSLFAVDFSGHYLAGLLALAAPAMMYWLLTSVSGIPLLEKHMAASRGALWQDYARKTPAFFPRF